MLKSFVGNAAAEFDIDRIDEAAWKRLAEKMSYVQGDLTKPELYEKIRGTLGEAEKTHGTQGNVIFYLAVADRFFGTVVEQLGKAKLTDQGEDKDGKHRFWRRVVIEKPFGHSLDSARELNARILRTLHEDQIFRIDHFLGKDTVQSIMAFRFANGLFEPIWNRDRIDHVQITVAETVGVERARQVLRANRGAARHGPEPRVHAPLDGGHGAAHGLRRRFDPHQEGRSVRRDARRQAGTGGAWPVWRRHGAGQAGECLSERAERVGGFEHRNLCRDAARDRQLALGRRALLLPYRQAHVAADDGDRDPLQAGALHGVPGHPRRYPAAQLAGAEHRAGRGHFPAVRGQASRAGGGPRRREDGLPLR